MGEISGPFQVEGTQPEDREWRSILVIGSVILYTDSFRTWEGILLGHNIVVRIEVQQFITEGVSPELSQWMVETLVVHSGQRLGYQ